jgi:ABC-2 type transport system permease protein
VLQLRRDRLTFGMIVGTTDPAAPALRYAINQDVRHLRAGVADLAGTQRARLLVQDAQATQVVEIVEQVRSAAALEALLRAGPDLGRPCSCRPTSSAASSAAIAQPRSCSSMAAIRSCSRHRAASCRCPCARAPQDHAAPDTFEVRGYYNPERRSEVQIVPGLMGLILTIDDGAVHGGRDRARARARQHRALINTPVRRPS